MYETILTPWQRALRALREFFDLSACEVFTVRQQIVRSCVSAAVGISAFIAFSAQSGPAVPTVEILDPVIERASEDYSVYRLRFAWLGHEVAACHLVAWHLSRTWTLRC